MNVGQAGRHDRTSRALFHRNPVVHKRARDIDSPDPPCRYAAARRSGTIGTTVSIDKLAPQAVEAEQSVLGSILIDPEAIL
ncbi:MAG TPA: hypothetical protein VL687_01510, partial [Methylomirabilota bacterium]|nr:hypothetical protein [Methylomirabilota bacterium]